MHGWTVANTMAKALEQMQIIKFDGQNWKLQGDLIQAKAN
jgi:hypothetical protein